MKKESGELGVMDYHVILATKSRTAVTSLLSYNAAPKCLQGHGLVSCACRRLHLAKG